MMTDESNDQLENPDVFPLTNDQLKNPDVFPLTDLPTELQDLIVREIAVARRLTEAKSFDEVYRSLAPICKHWRDQPSQRKSD